MIDNERCGHGSPVYEVTAYVERGWWLVHAVDIGRQAPVSTLGEVEQAARRMYATHLRRPTEDISVEITVYRSRPDAVARKVWRRMARRLGA